MIFSPSHQLFRTRHIANPTMFLKVDWVDCLLLKNKKLLEKSWVKNDLKLAINTQKGRKMIQKRTKKRNKLTTNAEIAELAYALHISANRLRLTISQINLPAAYRMQIARHVQWMLNQAKSLGEELSTPQPNAFFTKEATERICEQLGVFD